MEFGKDEKNADVKVKVRIFEAPVNDADFRNLYSVLDHIKGILMLTVAPNHHAKP
jgi:hypothetical protein